MMKKIVVLLVCSFVSLGAVAQDLTVASYNIRYRNDGDAKAGNGWEKRSEWVCGLIEFEGFDIFGAQEVLEPQLKDMLALLPGYAYIGVGRVDGKTEGEYGPIFYKKERFELLDNGHFWLSETPDRPSVGWDARLSRICTWGHFADRVTGNRFWFFNVHLDHVGVKARAESALLVEREINRMCGSDQHVILTGDFNFDQTDKTYALLADSKQFRDTYAAAEKRYAPNGTFNAFDPALKTDSRIDHIFVSESLDVKNYGVLTETYRSETSESAAEIKSGQFPKEVSLHRFEVRLPSDHFPVVVKLNFAK